MFLYLTIYLVQRIHMLYAYVCGLCSHSLALKKGVTSPLLLNAIFVSGIIGQYIVLMSIYKILKLGGKESNKKIKTLNYKGFLCLCIDVSLFSRGVQIVFLS